MAILAKEGFMTRRLVSLILCGGVAMLAGACATKNFVREEVDATERRLTEQMTTTENFQGSKLRDTAERVGETRKAVDVADQRLNGLDLRVGEAGARANNADTLARDVEARLSQRVASRNRYRLVETKSVYFDSGQIEVRSQDADGLEPWPRLSRRILTRSSSCRASPMCAGATATIASWPANASRP